MLNTEENFIPAKKSLGQNFLKSKTALMKMLSAGEVGADDTVLEVGPGKGALTEKLLEKAGKVIAVEKDDRLIEFLQDKFAGEIAGGKLVIVHDDILNFEPETFNLTPNTYKLIANIPYYITGQFLRKFLATPSLPDSVARSANSGFRESDYQPERIVVMVQKEIAQRIVANDPNKRAGKKESLLSVSVKAFGTPKMVMKVDKENFSPAPKVDSAILLISAISKKLFTENKITEKDFFEILHAGFAHKRKMLLGNLKEWFKKEGRKDGENLPQIFTSLILSEKIRAEDLPIQKWFELVKKLNL